MSGVEAGGGVRGDKEGMSQDGGEGQKAEEVGKEHGGECSAIDWC